MDVPTRTGRGLGEVLVSAGGLLILLLALVVFDDRLRDLVGMSGHRLGAADFADMGQQVNDAALIVALLVTQFVREQSFEHAHLVAFSGVAIVLVIFLLRL